jgi:hypothetical protein
MRKFLTRKGAITSALVLGSLIVGVAFAAWTQTGSGSATAKAVNPTNSAVTTDAAVADLYPGFTGGDVYFKIDNPNPYPVRFTSLTPGTISSSDPTNCPMSPAKVTAVSKSGLTIDVPANTTTPISKSVADVVTMDATAPDGCKGVTFTIAVTLSGSQQ